MNVRIFDIVNDEVEINLNVLLIPEFEALVNKYGNDAKKILAGIHYAAWPHREENPYYNIPELQKPGVIDNDFFKGRIKDYKDVIFLDAQTKIKIFYNSTILAFHLSHKRLMEEITAIMLKPPVEWPSNIGDIQKQLDKAGSMVEQFLKSQNAAVEDMGKTKGDLDEGYDEGRTYSGGL